MAPEVIENKNYTLKADVFSFGVIYFAFLNLFFLFKLLNKNI